MSANKPENTKNNTQKEKKKRRRREQEEEEEEAIRLFNALILGALILDLDLLENNTKRAEGDEGFWETMRQVEQGEGGDLKEKKDELREKGDGKEKG